jgi:hypothetical protein
MASGGADGPFVFGFGGNSGQLPVSGRWSLTTAQTRFISACPFGIVEPRRGVIVNSQERAASWLTFVSVS